MTRRADLSAAGVAAEATEYRTLARGLLMAADRTPDGQEAAALGAQAAEWRKLAIDADWQDAVETALRSAS